MFSNLYYTSIKAIKESQAPGGAYIASPGFSMYQYSWFRDSSFIAYAMDVSNHHSGSHLFHDWVVGAIKMMVSVPGSGLWESISFEMMVP